MLVFTDYAGMPRMALNFLPSNELIYTKLKFNLSHNYSISTMLVRTHHEITIIYTNIILSY